MTQVGREDPIREGFFNIIEHAEAWSGRAFAISAALSVAATVLDEKQSPQLFQVVQVAFLVTVLGLFGLDQWIRLNLSPRAAEARTKDFLSKAYGLVMSASSTNGYYNNSASTPIRKIAAQTFENAFFSKEIVRAMIERAAPIAACYLLVWVCAFTYRGTTLPLIATCAQALFGEQIVARLIRLIWLQRKCERVFEDLHTLYLSSPTANVSHAIALDCLTRYETAKGIAGITLSSAIFEQLNPRLSRKWTELRQVLRV